MDKGTQAIKTYGALIPSNKTFFIQLYPRPAGLYSDKPTHALLYYEVGSMASRELSQAGLPRIMKRFTNKY